jgi:hypothetical protein
MRLYEYASENELRTALIERNLRDILAQLEDLRRTLGERVGTAAELVPSADTIVTISPDDVSPFAIGFYAREYGSGRPYRWTGDGNIFELRIHLNRSCNWNFVMHADPATGVELQAIKGFVDYAEIPLQVLLGANRIQGSVSRRLFSNQLVLSFFHPQSTVPSQVDPNNLDSRSLSLAFYELKLSPELPQIEAEQTEIPPAPQARKGRRQAKSAQK